MVLPDKNRRKKVLIICQTDNKMEQLKMFGIIFKVSPFN